MSFSSDVKDELSALPAGEGHCALAELTAINAFSGGSPTGGAARRLGMLRETLHGRENGGFTAERRCCRRAYLRGAFLACGVLGDPGKRYALEFAPPRDAEGLCGLLRGFGLQPGEALRRGRAVVYIKKADSVADFLNIIGAHKALLAVENTRVSKDFNNQVNRRVNCETANLGKTAHAYVRQVEDIELIAESVGLGALPAQLEEAARLRLAFPDATLSEIGAMLNPPVGKSGVNHRLRRLGALAREIGESH